MRGVTTYNTTGIDWKIFQLTRLMRGVTIFKSPVFFLKVKFQLTRLMRGVTNKPQNCSKNY